MPQFFTGGNIGAMGNKNDGRRTSDEELREIAHQRGADLSQYVIDGSRKRWGCGQNCSSVTPGIPFAEEISLLPRDGFIIDAASLIRLNGCDILKISAKSE